MSLVLLRATSTEQSCELNSEVSVDDQVDEEVGQVVDTEEIICVVPQRTPSTETQDDWDVGQYKHHQHAHSNLHGLHVSGVAGRPTEINKFHSFNNVNSPLFRVHVTSLTRFHHGGFPSCCGRLERL